MGPLLILVSAAAASFGGHSALASMWSVFHDPTKHSSDLQMPEIGRSRGWIVAAVILALVFIAVLGPA